MCGAGRRRLALSGYICLFRNFNRSGRALASKQFISLRALKSADLHITVDPNAFRSEYFGGISD